MGNLGGLGGRGGLGAPGLGMVLGPGRGRRDDVVAGRGDDGVGAAGLGEGVRGGQGVGAGRRGWVGVKGELSLASPTPSRGSGWPETAWADFLGGRGRRGVRRSRRLGACGLAGW